jgi:hypothetical protein
MKAPHEKITPSPLPLWAAALTALVGVGCAAVVSWSGTAAELRVTPGPEKTVAEFVFRNSGSQPLHFTSLRPSCDGLSAAVSKESFAPGEMGPVRVEFTVGGRSGRQVKSVTVTTDDPADQPVTLLLVVDIPEPVAIRPAALFWTQGAVPEEKSFTIKVDGPAHATVTEATCVAPRFIPFLEPTAQVGTNRLRVRVTDSSTPAQATIRITTQLGERPLVSVVTVGIK